jgi:threonine dehydrogenase-like Zn-dependent dehydrogenase
MAQASYQSVRWNQDLSLGITRSTAVDPGPGEVQLAVGSVGICGSDLHFYRKDFPARAGVVPGHEFAGIVSAVGKGVKYLAEGDLVGVEPLTRCGQCVFCLSGDYHICVDRALIGERYDGGMSEFAVVPAITAFKAPTGVDGELAALAEPLACSVHGFAKVRLRGNETVFILGAGSIGLTAVIAAKACGAKVIVLARHPHQQAAARRLGADEVIGEDEAGDARVADLRKSMAIDVAVETVGGKGDTIGKAQQVLRPKGRLLVLGVFSVPRVTINPLQLALREIEIVGSMTYSASDGHADYDTALNILADYRDVARTLITHRFRLDEVSQAFATALDKSSQSIKVHMNPGRAA